MPVVGKQSSGTITVNSPRSYQRASVVSVVADTGSSAASAEVNENCDRDGNNFSIDIKNGPIATLYTTEYTTDNQKNTINLGLGTINGQTAAFSLCNLKLTIDSGSFSEGNLWTFTINPMIAADTITVGNITYTASSVAGPRNFVVESNPITAGNIVSAINNDSEILGVTASNSGSIVTVTARVAGAAGDNINLSSSNGSRLPVSRMSGGTNQADTVTVNGISDQPMNSAIQINFNEAIMPLTVSGTADDVYDFIRVVNADSSAKPTSANSGDLTCTTDADCKSFSCVSGVCDGDNEYLKGKFEVSNQYRTVEFLSDNECGFNNCGETIYCLPADSHLKVELSAASLISCDNAGTEDDSLCQTYSPFNTCDPVRKFCWNGTEYYPQAAKDDPNTIVDGIVDAAFNSLDGNRNDSAYGQGVNYYNENDLYGLCAIGVNRNKQCSQTNKDTICGLSIDCTGALTLAQAQANGDSYKWSFFISSLLELDPPEISSTDPELKDLNPADLNEAIKISFNELMLSSRLSTGSLMIQNGEQNIQHYLLNLRSFADQPLGYWVTNEPYVNPDNGEMIYTDAYINHSSFSTATTYKAQAGSGLKDIHQNCYLPSAGPGTCTGVNDNAPSCCDGTPTPNATCP